MHVKDFQAGKRSRCPECGVRFRVPSGGETVSIALPAEPLPAEPDTASIREKSTSNSASGAISSTDRKLPKPLQDSPGYVWFVRPPSGGQFGPADAAILLEWVNERRISRDSLLWREGWTDWQLASRVLDDWFPGTAIASAPPIAVPPIVPPPIPVPRQDSVAAISTAISTAKDISSPSREFDSTSALTSKTTTGQQRLLAKKRKQRKNQLFLISILSILSVILIIVLIVILWLDPFGKKVPDRNRETSTSWTSQSGILDGKPGAAIRAKWYTWMG